MTANAIEIRGLNKTYKGTGRRPAKTALHDIDLDIPRGSIFGLLGPNGAGKSTVINIMAGLTLKTTGIVRIGGIDIDSDPRSARAAIGVVPQELNFDRFFSPRAALELMAGFYGVPRKDRRTAEILRLTGLENKSDAESATLSGGMKRRLMIAKAMVHSPPILVLDEPTAGVDVDLRRQLWDNVRALNRRGVTILLTTHYLEEAEALCARIAIIHHGRIIACEDTEDLLSRIEGKEMRLRLDREIGASLPPELAALGAAREGRRTLLFRYNPKEQAAGQIIEAVQRAGYGIVDLSTAESNLEDVFLQLTAAPAA